MAAARNVGGELAEHFGRPIEDRLRALKSLHEDGLITDQEYDDKRQFLIDQIGAPIAPPAVPTPEIQHASTPEPVPQTKSGSGCLKSFVIVVGLGLGLAILVTALGSNSPDVADTEPSVATQDARNEVDTVLLGDSWIGSGSYTIRSARKAYRSSDDYQTYSARIDAPGAPGLCLYWRAGGSTLGERLIIGDTVTRQFSDWGSAADAGSPADQAVRDSKSTTEGRAVIAAVGC